VQKRETKAGELICEW